MTRPKLEKRILVLGDLHAPYMHKDSLNFLKTVKEKLKPTRVICTGDECDNHAISMHDSDPDLYSAGNELLKAIKALNPIYKLFPKVDVIESNHGSLVFRRAHKYGLPKAVLKSYREYLQAPKGWNWYFDLVIHTPTGPVYFHHGKSAVPGKLSQNLGMSCVQGHYHSNFYIYNWASPLRIFFDMNVGCLVDNKSLAMAYGKNSMKKPIIGCGAIIDGIPQLIPMILNGNGRWRGYL